MRKLVLLGLALALPALSGCAIATGLPSGAAYIPADAAFIVSLDLPGLASTDLYRALEERGGTVALNRLNFYRFAEMTGLNPKEDVKWLTFVGRAGGEGLNIDQLSALVSGTFDGAKTRAFLLDSGVPHTVHEELEIFQIVVVEDRCRFCIAILDDTTAAFGDGETLRAMAESRADPGRALTHDAEAARLLARVDRGAALWGLARGRNFAAPFAELLQSMAGAQEGDERLGKIEDISFFIAPGEKIKIAVDAVAADADDALMVADLLKGAGTMGRLALRQTVPDAAKLLTTFNVQVDGQFLRASTSFSQSSLLDLIQKMTDELFGRQGFSPFVFGGGWEDGSSGDSGATGEDEEADSPL